MSEVLENAGAGEARTGLRRPLVAAAILREAGMLPYVREVLRGYGFEVEAARAEHAPLPVVPLDERFDEPVNPWGESPTIVR